MAEANNNMFYSRLPVNEIPLGDLLTEQHLFFRIPEDWEVIITDVKNSTAATEKGMHQTVNLVATGTIVAVLNIAEKAGIDLPFFFGGDGATFIVPPSVLSATMQALQLHRNNTRQSFNMELRVGNVPVKDIYKNGHALNITKLKTTKLFSIPVLIGGGLTYAEKLVKDENYSTALFQQTSQELDLSGMQCRWDMIKPPASDYEVVSLLVMARQAAKQPVVFKKVIELLDELYGAPQVRRPIAAPQLRLRTTMGKISQEMKARFGGFRPFYLIGTWITGLLGIYYFKTKKGKQYLDSLVNLTDTLVIDGRINTVITGTPRQREQLETALNQLEKEGDIIYGLCVSAESVMSCYVRNMNDKHIHFVDGAGGGYTRAAAVLKKKILF
jgi:Protein of unknown function (DUF3095)